VEASNQALGTRSRASLPGSGRARAVVAVVALVAVVLVVAVVLTAGGGSSTSSHASASASASASAAKYGTLPSWLPKAKVPVNRVVQASVAHPALSAIEGATVSVNLAHGRVLATAVGPAVPSSVSARVEKDDDAGSETALCTFTITLRAASGVVPINPTTFSLLDERGQLHPFRISAVGGGGALPSRVLPGRTVTLTIKTTLPEGEGALRWAPDGRNVIVGWVYGLELD
jgi:hypothetical protein